MHFKEHHCLCSNVKLVNPSGWAPANFVLFGVVLGGYYTCSVCFSSMKVANEGGYCCIYMKSFSSLPLQELAYP